MVHKIQIQKLNQIVHHVFPFILLVVGISVIVGIVAIIGNPKKVFQQNTQTPIPTSPPPPPHTTYTSDKLGISFSYIPFFPNGIGQYFFTKEIGDTVYVYWVPGSNQPFSGSDAEFLQTIAPGNKYVEVFNKNPQQSLTDTIKQQFLTGNSENDCPIHDARNSHPSVDESFQTAIIDFPHNPGQSRKQREALVAKCPKYINSFDFVRYFMMDTKHPSKLLFVSLGQDNLPSGVDGLTWDKTIKVLQ